MENTNQSTHFSVTTLKILYEWKWHILIATVVTLIAAIFFSSPLFITPKYSSELILYPPHTLTTKTLIHHEPRFGSDLDADQHIQLLTSGVVFDTIVNRYNLIEHYEINTQKDRWQEKLNKKYNKNVSVRRTKFNSIRIHVRDKIPQKAAKIASSIAETGDNFRAYIFKSNLRSTFEGIENEFKQQEKIVNDLFEYLENSRTEHFESAFNLIENQKEKKANSVNDLLKNINQIRNEYGIFDLSEQINLLYEQIVIAHSNYLRDSARMNLISELYTPQDTIYINLKSRLEGSKSQYNELNKRLSRLTKANTSYSNFLAKYRIEAEMLSDVQSDFDKYDRSYHKIVPNLKFLKKQIQYETELEILLELRREYVRAQNNLNQEFLKSYIVQSPGVSNRPSHPKRVIIAIIPTILVFFSSCFIAIFSSIYIPKLKEAIKNN